MHVIIMISPIVSVQMPRFAKGAPENGQDNYEKLFSDESFDDMHVY